MAWFWKNKTKITAETLAGVMTENIFREDIWRTEPFGTLQKEPLIEAKIFFYKQALLMIAIYTKKHTQPEFWKLEKAVEEIIYPLDKPIKTQTTIRLETANGVNGLRELLGNINNNVGWSRQWFAHLGMEVDPTILSVFGLFWLGQLEAMIKTLDEIRLV